MKKVLFLNIKNSDLASFNENKSAWIVDAGEYTALVGASIDDIRQTVRFKVSKPFISEVHNVLKLKNDFNRMK